MTYSVSVIIPVYNVEKYLSKCLDSILIDNMGCLEIICVDDGSGDASGAILNRYSELHTELKVIHKKNEGLSIARNVGLLEAKGDYVYFLDSDDYLFPGMLKKMYCFAIENQLEMACFNVLKNGKQLYFESDVDIAPTSGDDFVCQFNKQAGFPYVAPIWMYLYKRSFLIANGLQNKEFRLHEDEEFTPRALFLCKRIALLNIPIQYHRVMREGAITSIVTEKHLSDSILNFRDLCAFFSRNCSSNITDGVFWYCVSTLKKANANGFKKKQIGFTCHDAKRLRLLSKGEYQKKISVLSYLSTSLMTLYVENKLPSSVRRLINRFL